MARMAGPPYPRTGNLPRVSLNPGKRCKQCRDGSCGSCVRGFIIKRPAKRSRIAPKASGRQDLDHEYTAKRKVFLGANPRCLTLDATGPCNRPSTDVHHRKGRGRYHLDERTWWACCSSCHHLAIHARPEWAYKMKYLLNRASNNPIEPPSEIFIPY